MTLIQALGCNDLNKKWLNFTGNKAKVSEYREFTGSILSKSGFTSVLGKMAHLGITSIHDCMVKISSDDEQYYRGHDFDDVIGGQSEGKRGNLNGK